jgi:hypothetical protein
MVAAPFTPPPARAPGKGADEAVTGEPLGFGRCRSSLRSAEQPSPDRRDRPEAAPSSPQAGAQGRLEAR